MSRRRWSGSVPDTERTREIEFRRLRPSPGPAAADGAALPLQPLVRLGDGGVEVGLAAQTQDHRIARLDVGAVPVGRSRTFWIVSLVVPSSLDTCASLSCG